jgi:hypothetical protein
MRKGSHYTQEQLEHIRASHRKHFTEIINTYYGGKCYLSKEEMTQLTAIGGV